ncbi:MAG: GNAT family N-acetyltransferase [Geodermatophilaceae bacterium]
MTAAPEPVEIRWGTIVLRPWTARDVDEVFAAVTDPDISLWNGSAIRTPDEAVDWIARRADWSDGDHVSLAVVDAMSGELVGSVSLHKIDREQGDAEIGYWTAPAARDRGVASSAVSALCRWAFLQLPIDRIELCHAVENPASARVAERAGFIQEGRLRQSYRYGDGRKHDELLWSLLREDLPIGS